MNKYAALCCYFGQWPNHFQVWLDSCGFNTNIDFFVVSDIPTTTFNIPSNVHIVAKSFSDIQNLIQTKFTDVPISLDRPYKLCDFKPAYGYVFEDLFHGYDYWGYCDLDTIWGDILKFIPENNDSHLIKIFPCGHLSFIRNVHPYNKIYELVNSIKGTPCRNNMTGRKVVTWQECFSSSENFYYDEEGGLEPWLVANTEIADISYSNVDFDNILPPWRFDHFISINFPDKSNNLVYSFEDGHLYRHYLIGCEHKTEEISYLHLSKRHIEVILKIKTDL